MIKMYTDCITRETARKSAKELLKQNASERLVAIGASNPINFDNPYILDDTENPYANKPPMLFTNETDSYIENLKGENALVIAGAGEQIIDLIRSGYSRIVAVDINEMQIFVAILKIYTIIKLDFAAFGRFWNAHSSNCFDFEVIKDVLSDDNELAKTTLAFWEDIFAKYNYNATDVRYNCITSEANFIKHGSMRSMVPEYAKNLKVYKKTQKILENTSAEVEYIISDIFTYKSKEKFDFITFSNIFNFVEPDKYVELAHYFIGNNLNNNGSFITYVIQLDEKWITGKIDIEHIPGKCINWSASSVVALDQQIYQANGVYKGLRNKGYDIRFLAVPTGKGYSAIYKTIKDFVMVINK